MVILFATFHFREKFLVSLECHIYWEDSVSSWLLSSYFCKLFVKLGELSLKLAIQRGRIKLTMFVRIKNKLWSLSVHPAWRRITDIN